MLVRRATTRDVAAIRALVDQYQGEVLLEKATVTLYEDVQEFWVAEDGGRVVGCGALHFYTPYSGEVRSLAVKPGLVSRGTGRAIVEALDQEAFEQGLYSVFAFTYVAPFFQKLGYAEVDRNELPLKAWKDCLSCPKFQCCDETAMLKVLRPGTPPQLPPLGEPIAFPILNH